jgi:hypothetical protein
VTAAEALGDVTGPAGVASRAEVCIVACAEAWRGDGEIAASPIGLIPTAGARLARATFEPRPAAVRRGGPLRHWHVGAR